MTALLIMITIVGSMCLFGYLYDSHKTKRTDIDTEQINKRFEDL
jgi:hypothetical protein